MTRLTVFLETPARAATSLIVGFELFKGFEMAGMVGVAFGGE